VAGQVEQFAKVNAEPALVLSIPDKPSEDDDGLLTASEIAMLKLNADFVVLSACNTAAEDKPGAEAQSGLARAFFYAGAKSLVVSHWNVDSEATVALMEGLFESLRADPRLSHAEALRMSMLRMIANSSEPELAQPKFWAPFVVVGEPMKPPGSGDGIMPQFDISLIGRAGDAVIAGRAAPGATLELLRNGELHDRVVADQYGQFVMVPPGFLVGIMS